MTRFADSLYFIGLSTRAINTIAEALTADHHFEQAGFVALLK
jgi:hypothetical protein